MRSDIFKVYQTYLLMLNVKEQPWKVPDGMIDAGHCTSCV